MARVVAPIQIGIQPEFVSNAPADGRGSARRYAYLLTKKDVAAGRELPRTFCVLPTASSWDRSAVSTVLPRHLGWLRALLVILASPRALTSRVHGILASQLAPDVLVGKPVIRGTRLSVEFVIGLMADGWSEADILGNYPGVTHDDIIACLAYARDTLSSEKVFPSTA